MRATVVLCVQGRSGGLLLFLPSNIGHRDRQTLARRQTQRDDRKALLTDVFDELSLHGVTRAQAGQWDSVGQ